MTPEAFQLAVLVAITTGILAALVTQGGALTAGYFARRHEDRTRFIDLKRERYSTLLRGADQHVRLVKRQYDAVLDLAAQEETDLPKVESTDPLSHLAAEITLLGRRPEVGAAATAVYDAAVDLGRLSWSGDEDPSLWIDRVDAPMDAAIAACDEARTRFLAAAKHDLGTA